MTTFKIACDVKKDFNFIHAITTRKGEKGNIVEFQLFNGGLAWSIGGINPTFKLRVETPNGHYIEQTTGITVTTNKVTVNMVDKLTNEIGQYKRFYLEITDSSGKQFTTPDIKYYVLPDANITGVNAQDYIDRVEEMIEQMNEIINKTLDDFELSLKTLDNRADTIASSLNHLTKGVEDLQALMDELVANGAMTKQQADTYYMKAGLPTVTDQDWNEIKTIGSYSVEGATGSNPPKQNAWGTLLVLGKSDSSWQKTQLFVSAIDMWFRRFDGSNWQDWSQAGSNFKAATPEEIIVGERDDVVVTPKGLKEATESTVPYIGYFDFGSPVENISITYPTVPIGKLVGTSPNGAQKQPFIENGDGTLTLTRACKMRVEATMKFVAGNTTPSVYAYFEMRVGTAVNRLGAIGSTKAQNGSLNYDWNLSSDIVISGNAGDVIRVGCSLPSNMITRLIQITALTLTEILPENTQGLNISALVDNPVIRLEDLESLFNQRLLNVGGQHIVWGENNQVTDPTTVGFGTFYASTNNEYKSLSDGESYFRYDAKGLIIVEKSGTYKVSAVVKRQYRTALTAWHYVSLTQTLVDGGSVKWDFSPIGGTVQNRNRHFAQCIITFSAGDRISFVSESNAPTASPTQLQFINIDQFCMERLGD